MCDPKSWLPYALPFLPWGWSNWKIPPKSGGSPLLPKKSRKTSHKDMFPTDPGHAGHCAAAKMPVTMLLTPLGLHPCVGCGGQRDRSWGSAHLPGLSCSRCRAVISGENIPEFPLPLGRAILSPPAPFSKTPCEMRGDLIHSGR